MTNSQVILEAIGEVCACIGFFLLLIIICVALRWLYDVIVDKVNNNKAEKSRQQEIIRIQKKEQRELDDRFEYYNLQGEDFAKNIGPNKKLLEVCNWD